jgi:23S rRNA pseudouridine2605 synthase
MNNKFPKKGHAEKHDADEFQAERTAAKKKFTDADKKEFWKNFDKDFGASSGRKDDAVKGGEKRNAKFDRTDRKASHSDKSKSYSGGKDEKGQRAERNDRKSFGDRPKKFEGSEGRADKKSFGERRKFEDRKGEGKSFGDRPRKFEGGEGRADKKSFGERRKFEDRKGHGSHFSDERPKRYEDRERKEGNSFSEGSKGFKDADAKPEKKTFQDVMNSAYSQRFDKGDNKKEPREERPPIVFETVELKDRFETKRERKESFERREPKEFKPRRGDRPPSKAAEKETARAAFLEHFDNENPNEKVYDAKGNRGVRTEQQAYGNIEIMPLNKFIAHCGVCSRRDAVELIKKGKISINGKVATEPGYKVLPEDIVQLDGKPLKVQKNLVYVLLNKPKGFITTTDDPKGRRTVMDILGDNIKERMFPVGRLDRNTTGLLLLTNDGEMAQQLSHPKYENRKIYQVTLDRNVSKADFEQIIKGLELEDGITQVDQLEYLDKKNEIGIEIHSGKNRIVRRIFEHLGYEVEKLDRVMYAGLTKKNLKRGQWRFLTKQEVINLKHLRK